MRKPHTLEQLGKIDGMKTSLVRQFGESILVLVSESMSKPQSFWPERLPRPMNPQMGEWFKELKKTVSSFAEQFNIPPEIILRKQPIKELLESGYPSGPFKVPDSMRGWREEQLVPQLMATLNQLKSGQ